MMKDRHVTTGHREARNARHERAMDSRMDSDGYSQIAISASRILAFGLLDSPS
jgi:hypothetical protein